MTVSRVTSGAAGLGGNPSGRQPCGMNQIRSLSTHRGASQASRNRSRHTCRLAHSGFQLFKRLGQAVDRLFLLGLKRAEHPVPDDQRAGVVLVQILGIARVVHAMMRRRVEHPFQRAQLADQAGVDPELVERVEARHRGEPGRRKAHQRQRQVEDPGEEPLERPLPQRHREVVILARMVHHVPGPGGVVFVGDPVEPVVRAIDPEEQHDRRQPLAAGRVARGRRPG